MVKFSDRPEVAEQQMNAIIFYLTAFGYIDGDFDRTEKTFVKTFIQQLVTARANAAMPTADLKTKNEVVGRFVTHFHEIFEQVDAQVRNLFTEAVSDREKVEQFVYAKLKLRCYEIFHTFDRPNQEALLRTVDELIYADGSVHPSEQAFRTELHALLDAEIPLDDKDLVMENDSQVEILPQVPVFPKSDNHPLLAQVEEHYSADPDRIRAQAERDRDLMQRFIDEMGRQRLQGAGRLGGASKVTEFTGAPFLDGHVYVHPTAEGQKYELFVLGDLHGCYSCLKGALMQADFFAKLEAWRIDPRGKAEPKLILLGDYIDRGMFSYNGVLRTVMQLFLTAPKNVFVLRGNHEYYIEYRGRIYGGVKPAEAINTLVGHMPGEMFEEYMNLFETLPNLLFFDKLMFVHAGIPRDAELAAKYKDLSSLNDPDLRFQMLWSDPSSADFIPGELQEQNARFPFGRRQFEAFMNRIGCTMMVRGHEKVDEGFRSVYPDGAVSLLNLFSAGGADNNDLPEGSSYRSVTPMAMTIKIEDGAVKVMPWEIDYKRFNDPKRNRFFATEPEIEHKVD